MDIGEVAPGDLRIIDQLEHQRIELVPLARAAHLHPPALADLDEAALGERTDHLPCRRLRDAELLADLELGRRWHVPADLPVGDPPGERSCDLVAQLDRAGLGGLWRPHGPSCMVTM